MAPPPTIPQHPPGDEEFLILSSGAIQTTLAPFSRVFAQGIGSGLLALATASWPTTSCLPLHSLKSIAREALTRFARVHGEYPDDDSRALAALIPDREWLRRLSESFPPVPGGEFLSPLVMEGWHCAFRDHVADILRQRNITAGDWLQSLGSPWNHIGGIFFHLAENKDDTSGRHPFAFLATFAYKANAEDQISHLPLGNALKIHHDQHAALLSLLKPLRDAAAASPFVATMTENKRIFSPSALTASEAASLLRNLSEIETAGISVRMVNLWKKPPPRLQVTVTAEQNEHEGGKTGLSVHSLLHFSFAATIAGYRLTPEELESLLESGEGLVRFHGEWVAVDAEKIRQLLDNWGRATNMLNKLGIPLVQGLRILLGGKSPDLPNIPADDSDCLIAPGEHLAQALEAISRPQSPLRLTPLLEKTLRPYQREGAAFLHHTTACGFGACLADDMGLGKTLQTLAWISHLKEELGEKTSSPPIPVIIVAPASLLDNWKEECSRYTPHLSCLILHPSTLPEREINAFRRNPGSYLERFDLVVTTYGMAGRMNQQFSSLHFPALILDEAQAIKNFDSQRSRDIRAIPAQRKAALSGTPVENNLSELWSLMEFINPGLLGGKTEFDSFIKRLGTDFSPLRNIVRPVILRRMKTDPAIAPTLPDKTERPVYCRLSPSQALLYQREINTLHALLEEPDPARRLMLILPLLARLKQICNHPAQYLGAGEWATEESGKFIQLRQLARSIATRQEKLILFTQFRSIIAPLYDLLADTFNRPGLILHGSTPVNTRQELVNTFQQETGPPFFILSLKAAGTGLTLTQASHVIHFDRWWNPAVENQATDRAYRIGQSRNVLVHQFICKGTIEERIDSLLRSKRELADSLFSGGIERLISHMNPREIRELLTPCLTVHEQ